MGFQLKVLMLFSMMWSSSALFIPAALATELSPVKVISSSTDFAKKIPLHLVILDSKSWSEEEVLVRIRRTEKIYSVCDVQFSPIKIQIANDDKLATFDYTEKEDIALIERLNIQARPLMFFAKKNSAVFAWDAYSWTPSDSKAPRTGVGFIFESWKYTEQNWVPEKEYEVLAHELAHILFNEDHNEIPKNLLAFKRAGMGDQVTPEQCAKLHESTELASH